MTDNMTTEQRSRTMSRIRSKNTQPELLLRRLLHAKGLRYRIHVARLPGNPDIVFCCGRVAIFVDGDYWHGWRFACWAHKLSPYWRGKIALNRSRDSSSRRRLRRLGWIVIRIWEHQIRSDVVTCAEMIAEVVRSRVGT